MEEVDGAMLGACYETRPTNELIFITYHDGGMMLVVDGLPPYYFKGYMPNFILPTCGVVTS